MIILILALIFGLAVLLFSIYSFKKAKRNGSSGKVLTVLKLLVMFEALVYTVIFAYVFVKTLLM